ncbi:MAG: precorrin-2 C(20)-methyltransferase [bacterium]|nr:precorrin-2 C(20)-methyltransferase [bacterium]
MTAILYGVGVGPGDPEELTLKAVRVIKECDVIAIPSKSREDCVAYSIAKAAIPQIDQKEIVCISMPMTRDLEYLEQCHKEGEKALTEVLDQGKSIAFLTLGDPTVYSTYMYLHERVAKAGYETKIVSGIASFLAASAVLNQEIALRDTPIHIVPSVYGISDAMKLPGTKILMKAASRMPRVREELLLSGHDIRMVENCGMANQKVYNTVQDIPDDASYYSLIIAKEKK